MIIDHFTLADHLGEFADLSQMSHMLGEYPPVADLEEILHTTTATLIV